MVYTEKQVADATTENLIVDALTLHFILYEQHLNPAMDKKRMLNIIADELKKRGHEIGWTGITG